MGCLFITLSALAFIVGIAFLALFFVECWQLTLVLLGLIITCRILASFLTKNKENENE